MTKQTQVDEERELEEGEGSSEHDVEVTTPEEEMPEETPRRRGLKIVGAFLLTLVVGIGVGRLTGSPEPPGQESAVDHSGHDHGDTSKEAATTWTCSMHPQIQSPEPGTCPICGMDLIPATDSNTGPELGAAQVRLTPRAKSLARIRTQPVKTSSAQGAPKALFGRVVEDEEALRAVTSWISGRIDKLSVSTTGERVRRGQTLAKLYSPEVYAAHQDLLVAREQLERLEGADEYAKRSARGQLDSARQRLRLLGFTASELKRMERADKPWTQVPVRATASGTVLRRKVRQGEYVQQGQILYELSDLKTVWVELDAYESDLERLEVGQSVTLSFDALPDKAHQGTITFIDPVIDPRTRVASVRVEVDNSDAQIKPGMYVDATLEAQPVSPGQPLPLVIPASAPLFAGGRALVYVEASSKAEGTTYEAREVVLGARLGDAYIVRAGLGRGEYVVSHGAFALDSDLQIRGNLSLMARPDDTTRPKGHAPLELDSAQRESLRPMLTGYLDVGESLANDDLDAALTSARAWRGALKDIALGDDTTSQAWRSWSRRLEADLDRLTSASDLKVARSRFSEITGLYDELLERFGNVLERPIRKAYCPMANENKGDHWYQRAEQVDNVYFGNQMRRCGEIQRTVDAGEHALLDHSTQPMPGEMSSPQGGGHVH